MKNCPTCNSTRFRETETERICEKCGYNAYIPADNKSIVKCDMCGVLNAGVNRYAFAPYTSVLGSNIFFGGGVTLATWIKKE